MPQTTFRRHERVACEGEVTVLGQSGVYRGHVDNLSETGIAIALPKSFTDTHVTIEIPDAAGRVLSVQAIRCHAVSGFHGFRFEALSPEQRETLRQICSGTVK